MKTYTGKTELFEERNVYVDGQPLAPRLDLREHSPTGFDWGYAGSGPAPLALAILADHAGDQVALRRYLDFRRDVIEPIGTFDTNHWVLTGEQIDRWLAGERIEIAVSGHQPAAS